MKNGNSPTWNDLLHQQTKPSLLQVIIIFYKQFWWETKKSQRNAFPTENYWFLFFFTYNLSYLQKTMKYYNYSYGKKIISPYSAQTKANKGKGRQLSPTTELTIFQQTVVRAQGSNNTKNVIKAKFIFYRGLALKGHSFFSFKSVSYHTEGSG